MEISVELVFVISVISRFPAKTTDVTLSRLDPINFSCPPRNAGEGPKTLNVGALLTSSCLQELRDKPLINKQFTTLTYRKIFILCRIIVFYCVHSYHEE